MATSLSVQRNICAAALRNSRAALSRPWHALLDDMAAKVRIDNSSFGSFYCFAKQLITDTLLACITIKVARFEDPHLIFPTSKGQCCILPLGW
jgi:hypothetical protein